MSRRATPFGGPCHDGEEWTCQGPCGRVQCNRCDGIPDERFLCWECINDNPEDAA